MRTPVRRDSISKCGRPIHPARIPLPTSWSDRMRRSQPLCLALVLLLTAVPVAHAQLGGLKKKVAAKITGKDTVAVAGQGAAQPKCDASFMVITTDVVDHYLASMAARDAEMKKLAKEPGKTGAYYVALLRRQEVERRRAEYELHRGPDWDKAKALRPRLMTGDGAAARELAALEESLEPGRVELPEPEWENVAKGSARVDSTMRVAGGFSVCDWKDLSERIPRMVALLANDPNTKDLQGYGTAKDAAVIRPRLAELARALRLKYVSPEDQARLAADAAAEKAAAEQIPSSGDAETDCMTRAQQKWAKDYEKELEAATKKEDVNAILNLTQVLNKELAKCTAP